ncbi:LysM peptidoglycan-binding domain-containing protein, partial [Microbulbifer sp. JSM ZJ756]|uniref:LysM peptidoglycan-binding domain-containing protein n=1 Tax=Microbulbifer sp. JSM ZJ756 TaxID=3376191 RepID=UPI00378D6AC4
TVYDDFGNAIEVTDKNGNTTYAWYDDKDRLLAQVDPEGYLVEWDYDAQDNVLEQRVYTQPLDTTGITSATRPAAPAGEVYTVNKTYDAANRVIEERSPLVDVLDNDGVQTRERVLTLYTYDGKGNQTSRTVAAGTSQEATEYSYYDAADRKVAVINSDRVLHTYSYDENGNLTERKRYYNAVAAGVNLASLSGDTAFATLVASHTNDQATTMGYDAGNRQTSETDLMDAANDADDITKTIRYNARGEQTWAQDGDGFVTEMAYDAAGRITKNISPDGTGSTIQYDAAGNQTLVYTGEIDSVAQPVNDDAINAEFGDMLVISWNMPQGVDQKSWVVWGSTSQADITVDGQPAYDNQSAELGTWFSDTGEVYIPSEEFGEGEALYFRVVTADRAGNLAWSEEKVLRVPPTLGAIDVDRIDSDTTTITVEAGSNAQNVALKYGTAGATSTATPVAMQPNGDGTWTVTIDGVTNLDEKSFRISWQDAAGTDYESTEKTFVASDPHVGVTTQLGETTVMSGETTSYIINLDTRVPAETASQFSTVVATLTDDSGDTVTAAVEGVDNGDGTWSYLLDLGTSASPLAAGSYQVSLEGAYADTSVFGAQELLLDQFSVELSETAALSGTRQGLTWQAADLGTEAGRTQLVLVDGQWVQSTRNADGQLFVSTELAPGTHSYNAFYGEQVGTGYSLDISSTEITEEVDDPENPGTTITNVLGYDQDFSLTLDPAEVANINGDLTLSWRAAGSGLDFTDSTVMAFDGTSHAATLSQLQEGAYDVKLSYTDADGNEVIVQWLRLDSAQVTSGTSQNYIGNSVTVLGSETGGSINVAANGLIDFSTGLYSGPGGDERNYVDITLDSNNNPGGTRTTNGVDAGYFTANRYNALNQLVATNEGNGIWRHFGVDANGNQVATYTTGENGDDLAAATEVRDSYAVFDGRNRMVTEYGVATGVFGETGLVRPETTYGYDVQDNQVSVTDARGYNTSRDFNALGMMTWENDNRTGITYHHYDRLGNETKMVDQLGNETSKRYDTAGRLVEEINGEGDLKRYTYDAFGRRVSMSVVDTVGSLGERTTSFVYDNRDRLVKQTDAGGNELNFGYDNRDNRTHSWDIANDLTRQEYDGLNRVTLTEYEGVNGNLVTETRQYDAYGNLIAEKDAEGRVTSHEYGAFGRKIATIDQGGRKVAYEYDEFGNQVREYRPVTTSAINTGLWNFGFDGAELSREDFRFEFGKLYRSWDLFGTSGTSYSSGPDIHREYDDAGRLLTVWDKKTDIATTYQYDEMGNRMSEVVAEVDVNGDPTKTLRNISYDYDETGQMSRWHDSVTGQHLNYLWDAAGNQKRVYTDVGYAGEAVNHWYNYDGANRVTQMLDGQAGDIISGFTYDGLGQRATWNNGEAIVTYDYNLSGWVKSASWTDPSNGAMHSTWQYDADGNISRYETRKGTLATPGEIQSYSYTTYSANGISTFSDSDDQKTYSTYDDSGRLLKTKLVTEDATYTYTYYYHGDGREQKIVGKGDAKGTSTYTYDANDKLTRLDKGKGDNQDSKEYLTFVYNNDGQILYRYHDEGTDNDISETEFQYANGHAVGEKKTWQNGDPAEEKLDTGDYNLMQNIGEDYPSGAVTSVTAVDGDSLQSIAARVYGNPSLWFVLAAANGLDPSQPIKGGVKISVPNTVETGRLDADTHKVYNENDIIGSTLPNLKTPKSDDDCGNILMIIVAVVITAVASFFLGPLAAQIGTYLVGLGASATVASVGGLFIAGALLGAAASIVQQGIFIALGYQESFDWKQVAAEAVTSAFTAGAQGLGGVAKAAKLSTTMAKVAAAATRVVGAAAKQFITNGKITSWSSLAAAAIAPTKEVGGSDNILESITTLSEVSVEMITPWLGAAETYIREGELSTGDWVAAVGQTIGAAVGNGDNQFEVLDGGLQDDLLIGGAMSLIDKQAGKDYVANAVGQEAGGRIAGYIGDMKFGSNLSLKERSRAGNSQVNSLIDTAGQEVASFFNQVEPVDTGFTGGFNNDLFNRNLAGVGLSGDSSDPLALAADPLAQNRGPQTYAMQSGDNPSSIARQQLGPNASERDVQLYAQQLLSINPELQGNNTRGIQIGTEVVLPTGSEQISASALNTYGGDVAVTEINKIANGDADALVNLDGTINTEAMQAASRNFANAGLNFDFRSASSSQKNNLGRFSLMQKVDGGDYLIQGDVMQTVTDLGISFNNNDAFFSSSQNALANVDAEFLPSIASLTGGASIVTAGSALGSNGDGADPSILSGDYWQSAWADLSNDPLGEVQDTLSATWNTVNNAANTLFGAAELAVGGTWNGAVSTGAGFISIPALGHSAGAAVAVQEGVYDTLSWDMKSDGAKGIINALAPAGQYVGEKIDTARAYSEGQIGDLGTTVLFGGVEAGLEIGGLLTGTKGVKSAIDEIPLGARRVDAEGVGVPNNKINMRSADDLMGVEPASPELISAVSKKRDVVIAQPGSEELRMLDYFGAEASVGGANNTHILLRENPSKAALLEEFLHGTQSKLGITDRLGTSGLGSAETHVKDFMIRHQKMLGLGDEDVQILQILRDKGL